MPISSGALGNPNSYYNKPENIRAQFKRNIPKDDLNKKQVSMTGLKVKPKGKENGGKGKKKKKKKGKKGKKKAFDGDDDGKQSGPMGTFRRMFTGMFSNVGGTKVQDISGNKNGKGKGSGANGAGAAAGVAIGAGGGLGSGRTDDGHGSCENTTVSIMTIDEESDSDSEDNNGGRKKPLMCCGCCPCRCYLCCCCWRCCCWLWLLLLLLLLLAALIVGIYFAVIAGDETNSTAAPITTATCDGSWGDAFFGYRKNESDINSTYVCCYNYSEKATNETFYKQTGYVVINKTDCLDTGATCLSVWKDDPGRCLASMLLSNPIHVWCVVFVAYLYLN